MQSRLFWKDWPKPLKTIYYILLTLALASILWFAFNYIIGAEGAIGWETLAKTERVKVLIDSFKLGPFTLSTADDNILFLQTFTSPEVHVNAFSYYWLLGITVLGMVVFITIVSDLSNFWFFVGLTIFLGILVNFKFEILLLMGSSDKWGLIIAIICYLPISYYFNRINNTISFTTRLTIYTVITLALGIGIYFTAEVDKPFLYMATYGVINPLLVSLLFIIVVAHEIIAGFVYILTKSNSASSKNTITHFYVISAIYIVNVVLLYLRERHIVEWDIIYLNLFLLLTISAILGIWGFQQRTVQFKNILNSEFNGALLFIIMFICCFCTIAHFAATFNDPAIEIFRDIIVYSHLGFGIIFLIYITSNFIGPLGNNMQVYKVLYAPTQMPYFTFCFAGLIASSAFLFSAGWKITVNQGYATYYNGIADMHYLNGELTLAEAYYKQGALFGYNNHKSHFMLASISEKKQDDIQAVVNYKQAIAKNPTPQAYANLSSIYNDQDRFFEALFNLNEGLDKFPKHPLLENNLGIVYSKTNITDTALFYLDKAINEPEAKKAAQSNLLALLVKNQIPVNADSLFEELNIANDLISINNKLALKNQLREPASSHFSPSDSVLSFLEASVLYNQSFNHLFAEDSLNSASILALTDNDANASTYEMLSFALSINWYKQNNINDAFRKLNWLANNSPYSEGKYFNTLGLWALEQNAPEIAAKHFKWAEEQYSKEATYNKAIALTEASQIPLAIETWQSLAESGDQKTKEIAATMLTILNPKQPDFNLLPENQKYLFLRYQLNYRDTTLFNQLVNGLTDSNYKGQAILDMSKKLWKKDLEEAAVAYYTMLSGLQITDKSLFESIQWYELKMLAAQGNVRGLGTKINQGITFDKAHNIERHYYTGLINEASGDTLQARKNYEAIAYMNPFKEEATIAAANFIGMQDKFEAYNILLNAIEINPNSVRLLKAYILQCARVKLSNYAELSLQDLRALISANAYNSFVNKYNQLVKQVEEEDANF
ncbi:hypothetical protein LVD15_12855 [Fulvivirga maritima]|uniref:tetratricopeptide repeat protein n=1 Tax=Fulvivirga maritima TaxID=2904247 RepID=UPI001F368A93|nr:hypothetical protein [Fulvivirga maritima]UII29275.1 hypothetical protein LVD15_12855 [Fulvivirga maritima]